MDNTHWRALSVALLSAAWLTGCTGLIASTDSSGNGTGSGSDGLRLARDKVLSKQIVAGLGVAVPRYFVADGGDPVSNPGVPYPLIVKPQFGDGSDEISNSSIVNGAEELRARVESLHARSAGTVLCEEYIEGRDLFVALLGNEPQVMPPLELTVRVKGAGSPRIATRHLKHDARYRASNLRTLQQLLQQLGLAVQPFDVPARDRSLGQTPVGKMG